MLSHDNRAQDLDRDDWQDEKREWIHKSKAVRGHLTRDITVPMAVKSNIPFCLPGRSTRFRVSSEEWTTNATKMRKQGLSRELHRQCGSTGILGRILPQRWGCWSIRSRSPRYGYGPAWARSLAEKHSEPEL